MESSAIICLRWILGPYSKQELTILDLDLIKDCGQGVREQNVQIVSGKVAKFHCTCLF